MRGGSIKESEFERMKPHNLNVFFDKGQNNPWSSRARPFREHFEAMCKSAGREEIVFDDEAYGNRELFEECLTKVLRDRYHSRISNLRQLMNLGTKKYGSIINLDFIEDFYINLFKGSAFKKYFPEKIEISDDLRKRYNIFSEYEEEDNKVPKKKYFTFVDSPNPCHIVKIMKDEYNRGENEMQVKYAFVNVKELGRGKAGIASLLGFFHQEPESRGRLQVAAKLMKSSEFEVTNGGLFLPLRIMFLQQGIRPRTAFRDRNIRYHYPIETVKSLDTNYPEYSKYNVFDTTHREYEKVMLSVASDNFSNQTIQHMIIEQILGNFRLPNYVKQFDAILCYNWSDTFAPDEGERWWDFIKRNTSQAANYIGRKLDLTSATVDGLSLMEIADHGDLHGHLFEVQRKTFSRVRTPSDLAENQALLRELQSFLNGMISQILKPLSILQHSRFAFVHGDLKSKNVFVKKERNQFIYKIADYDKSSINYNGIRFHNEGNNYVKIYYRYLGSGKYARDKDDFSAKIDGEAKSDATVYNFDNDELIDIVLKPTRLGKKGDGDQEAITGFNDLVIEYLCQNKSMPRDFENRLKKCEEKGLNLRKLLSFLRNAYGKLLGDGSRARDQKPPAQSVDSAIDLDSASDGDTGAAPPSEERMIAAIYRRLLRHQQKRGNIDIYYTLTGMIARMSLFVTSLENVEFEQMFVRYSPLPFYHTIDLYTLFLSLLQSPMIFNYLKYCQLNQDRVQDDLFWKSFRDLWASDEDIYTILGYYDYLYRHPVLEEIGSIGFILDPIKKNPIPLIKQVDQTYWRRAWEHDGQGETYDAHKQQLDGPVIHEKPTLRLTRGSIFTKPQICLSDCRNFDLKVHRGNKVYYLNKDLTVYSISTYSERVTAAWKKNEPEQVSGQIKDNYKESLRSQLLDYLGTSLSALLEKEPEIVALLSLDKSATPPPKPKLKEIKEFGEEDSQKMELIVDQNVYLACTGRKGDSRDDYLKIEMDKKKEMSELLKEKEPDRLEKILNERIFISGKWFHRSNYSLRELSRQQLENTFFSSRSDLKWLYDGVVQFIVRKAQSSDEAQLKDSPSEIKEKVLKIRQSILEEILKSPGETDFNLTSETLSERIRAMRPRMVEEQKTAVLEEIRKSNEKRKSKNQEKMTEWENNKTQAASKDLKGREQKFQEILRNLRNKKDTRLDPYIEKTFQDKKDGAQDLLNACLTNTYEDVFGNYLNWDFCPISEEYLKQLMGEVRLF
jgi:hypothetical protein